MDGAANTDETANTDGTDDTDANSPVSHFAFFVTLRDFVAQTLRLIMDVQAHRGYDKIYNTIWVQC